jgi:hypothetical protein
MGIDRAGHDFAYRLSHRIDPQGSLPDGRTFSDIRALKALLAGESRQLARNLLHQFTAYATGGPVRFSDRRDIEAILDACAADGYRVRDLVHGFVASGIFREQDGAHATLAQLPPYPVFADDRHPPWCVHEPVSRQPRAGPGPTGPHPTRPRFAGTASSPSSVVSTPHERCYAPPMSSPRMVSCVKLKKEAPGLDKPPFPGELGKRLFEVVSAEGWDLWLEHQKMLEFFLRKD